MASLREENFDQIIINDLKAYTTIGVFPEEQHTRQQVIVNIRLFIDLQQPCQTDQLEDTLDYS
ncbi:MAG: dihydroneopterin aldolase, partial [Candidatus Bipolaricaulota bacterium]